MILIISDRNDVHPNKVERYLKDSNSEYVRFNIDVESLKQTTISFSDDEWEIKSPTGILRSSEVNVIWNRRTYVELLLEEVDTLDVGFKIWKGEWNKTLLGLYSSLESKKWLNFYRNSYYAENKYRQYSIARELNFRVPSFICSNDKKQLFEFFNDRKEKVIKFMNQDFYKINDNNYKGIYVNKININDLDKFREIGENPIILQDYIHKLYEVRYTVVGNDHLVCRIDSQSSTISNIDWRRYDLAHTPHSIIQPPSPIKKKVDLLMKKYNLNYGALDFVVSSNNEWYFLEMNSMGQFLWIEDLTGLKISESIANWLILNN